ncbi:MAG TPA: hypothetical protein VNU24_04640 [Solirubrobacteraceae bacterium]|jgi:hypothetical protein|nr:hypothetical protein [Solirubrobacteraceae bacterium]
MRRRPNVTILTCGVAVVVLGALLVLGAGGTINLRFAYTVPMLIAALGAILLASGLASRRRGRR